MTAPHPAPTPLLIGILGMLAGVGPLSTDLILPTFTGIAAEFAVDPAAVQLTLTAFLVGIGIGPLIVGPLADRYGRRPVLSVALIVYTLAALAMAFAPNIVVLVVVRVVQGLGASAAVVLSRSIAADVTHGKQAVRAISIIATILGVAALLAPLIGGALQTAWGWRSAFVFLTLLGMALLATVLLFVPETHPPHERTRAGGVIAGLLGIGRLLRRGDVRGHVVTIGAGYGALAAFLVASPFVGQVVLGLDPFTYGLVLALIASAMLVGAFVNALLATRVDARRMLTVGQTSIVLSSAVFLVLALTNALTVVTFIVSAFLLAAGTGLAMANATALTLAVAGTSRGSASALCSTGQYAMGAMAPLVVGLLGTGSALPMAITMCLFAVLGVIAAVLARLGEPRASV